MQMAYGDKKLFYKLFWFIMEKLDFPVEIPPEKEVLWFFFQHPNAKDLNITHF